MANSVRKNTVKLVFGPGVKVPSYLDVLRFTMDNLKLSAADMHSVYKDENGGQFYVKLIDEETFTAFIAETDEVYNFRFEDGSIERVRVEQASRVFRYVRIFNLPPEIEDSAIQYVLGQYGTIRQHVRERFPSEMKVDIYNGVRGVHMEVSKEIPAHLYVGHFRARIFYDGLKNKCFFCKAEGHMKQNCPKLAAVSSGSGSSTQSPGMAPLGRPVKPVIEKSAPMTMDLTLLKLKSSVTTNTTASAKQKATNIQQPSASITSTPTGTSQATPSTSSSNITNTATSTQQLDTNTQQPSASITPPSVEKQQEDTNTQQPGASITPIPTETPEAVPGALSSTITNTTKQADPTASAAEVTTVAQSTNTDETTISEQQSDMDTEVSEVDRQKMIKRPLSSSPDGSGGEGDKSGGKGVKGRAAPSAKNNKTTGFTIVKSKKSAGKRKKI